MDRDEYSAKIHALQEQLSGLQQASSLDERERQEAMLHNALEELRVAEEEMRQQNEELLNTRQALEAERQHYLELFNFAPEGYLETDLNGVVREINHAAANLLRKGKNWLIGKPLVLFISGEDHNVFYAQIDRLSRGRQVKGWEIRLQPHRGKAIHATVSAAVVQRPEGRLTGLRWLLRDVEAQAQRREAEAFTSRIHRLLSERAPGEGVEAAMAQIAQGVSASAVAMWTWRPGDAGFRGRLQWVSDDAGEGLRAMYRELYGQETPGLMPLGQGTYADAVLEAGEPLCVLDTTEGAFWGDPVRARHGWRSAYMTPLVLRWDFKALLLLLGRERNAFTEQERRRVEGLRPPLAAAVETWHSEERQRELNARLEGRVRQQEAILRINRAVQEMARASDLGRVTQVCLDESQRMGLNVQAMAVHRILDPEQNLVETFRAGPSGIIAASMRRKGRAIVECWESGQVLQGDVENSSVEEAQALREKFGGLPVRSWLDIPFACGVLSALSVQPDAFSETDVAVLRQMAGIYSVSIARVEDLERIEASRKALEESQRYIQRVADTSPDVLYVYDLVEQRYVYINNQVFNILGYTPEAIQKMGPEAFLLVHPDDRERVREHMEKMAAAGDGEVLEVDDRARHANGEWRWLHSRDIVFTRDADGSPRQALGTAQDITGHKRAEEQLLLYQAQLRSLASDLVSVQEQERRRIAMDLHDRIGQTLAVSKMALGTLRASASSAELAEPLEDVRRLIDRAIQDTRSLTFELSPPVLHELGLEAAIEWLAEQVQDRHAVRVEVEGDGQRKLLEDDVRDLLFRAVQELLVNVVKHAQARHARVSTRREGGEIRIEVEDDGVGVEVSQADFRPDANGGFGLFNIRERLAYVGGSLRINSEPGMGTRVVLEAPLKRE